VHTMCALLVMLLLLFLPTSLCLCRCQVRTKVFARERRREVAADGTTSAARKHFLSQSASPTKLSHSALVAASRVGATAAGAVPVPAAPADFAGEAATPSLQLPHLAADAQDDPEAAAAVADSGVDGGGGAPSKGAKKRARRARGHLKRCAGSAWDEAWAGADAARYLRGAYLPVCVAQGTGATRASAVLPTVFAAVNTHGPLPWVSWVHPLRLVAAVSASCGSLSALLLSRTTCLAASHLTTMYLPPRCVRQARATRRGRAWSARRRSWRRAAQSPPSRTCWLCCRAAVGASGECAQVLLCMRRRPAARA
jgi:hypothetical protein